MADERDKKIAAAYRALGAEEPPRALDEAILAAARREAGAGPATLRARSGRQRWYAPLATAAVLVLAVAVTLHMQQEQPAIQSPVVKESVKVQSAKVEAKPQTQPMVVPSAPARERRQKPGEQKTPEAFPRAREDMPVAEKSAALASAPDAAPSPAAAEMRASRRDEARVADSGAAGALARSEVAQATAQRAKVAAFDTPERELERIAELRRQQRHDEADKALADFRKRHPDYRIPGAMLERVERR